MDASYAAMTAAHSYDQATSFQVPGVALWEVRGAARWETVVNSMCANALSPLLFWLARCLYTKRNVFLAFYNSTYTHGVAHKWMNQWTQKSVYKRNTKVHNDLKNMYATPLPHGNGKSIHNPEAISIMVHRIYKKHIRMFTINTRRQTFVFIFMQRSQRLALYLWRVSLESSLHFHASV